MAVNNSEITVIPEFPIQPGSFIVQVFYALRDKKLYDMANEFLDLCKKARYHDQVIEAARRYVYIEIMP